MATHAFLWRRLDSPGHDACRFESLADGYRLSGMAAFAEAGCACQLKYEVVADPSFRTRSARVEGSVGTQPVSMSIRAGRGGRWRVDGVIQPALTGCLDVDLGFTPATNLLAIRRLALRVGQAAQAPAVYLDVPAMKVKVLMQRYRRVSEFEYDYESPEHGYQAVLRVSALGAVEHYPQVFEKES